MAALAGNGKGVVGVAPNGVLNLYIVKVFGATGWADMAGGHAHWYAFDVPGDYPPLMDTVTVSCTADLKLTLFQGIFDQERGNQSLFE